MAQDLHWTKSSFSAANLACIELARDGDLIALRDSKNPLTELRYTQAEIDAFILGAKKGDFDVFLSR